MTSRRLLTALLEELADESACRELAEQLRPHLADAPERLLDAKAKAQQMGVNPETLARWAREGKVPGARRTGKEWRFPTGELDIQPTGSRACAEPPASPRRARVRDGAGAAAIRGPKRCA
jgi:hypothetical protein